MPEQKEYTRPLSPYQKLLIVVFVLMLFTIVVDYMTLPALSAILLPDLNISTKEFGFIVSAYGVSAGISAFLATGFSDRFDRKKMLLVYYSGFLVGMVLCANANSFTTLIIARIITGSFGGVVAAICFAIVADLFQSDQKGRVMGYIHMAFAASLVLGLPLALYLANTFHWHFTYWLFLGFGSIVLLTIALKIKPINAHLSTAKHEKVLKHSLQIAKNKNYWIVFLNNIFLVLGDTLYMTFGSAYSTNNLGVSLDNLPILYGVGGLATIVLSPFIGQLSDKFGKLKVFTTATLIAILLVAIYSNLESVPFGIVLFIHTLLFIGINGRMIASTAIATDIPNQQDRGAFMALDSSFQQLAGGVAATAAGWIVYQAADGIIHGYPNLGWTVIAIMFITIILMFAIHRIIQQKS